MSGKKSLLRKINKEVIRPQNKYIKVEDMCSSFSAVDSAFLYVKDLNDPDQSNSIGV